jgi:flagellar motor switch protein FliN/FliY
MSEQTPAIGTLLESLASAMAGAVAALSGGTTTPVSADAPGTPKWLVRLAARGATSAEILVGVSDQDARRLAGLLMGLDGEEIGDDAVTDALREITGQAIAALILAPETAAVTLSDVAVTKAPFGGTPAASYAFQLPNDFVLCLVLGTGATPAPEAASEAVATSAQPLTIPAPAPVAAVMSAASAAPRNLDLLLDIELPLAVRFGQTELTLNTLTRLGPGSVIDLHRSADEPVEILVGGKMIARGEVVVVEGNYGVRVTEVLSTADRIRSLGA